MAVVAYRRLLHRTLLQDGLDDIILVAGAELVLELALGCAIVCSLCALAVCSGKEALVSEGSVKCERGNSRSIRGDQTYLCVTKILNAETK